MNLQSLRYFVRIVQQGSLTRAAANLNIAQPALTRHIQRLEDEFGVILLVRDKRGVTTTAIGDLLYRRGLDLLRDVDGLKQDLLQHGSEPAGRVLVGMTGTICTAFAPLLLQRIHAQHPQISVSISDGFSRILSSWVVNDDIDVALMSGGNALFGMNVLPIADEELVFLAQPGWFTGLSISTDELLSTRLTLTDSIGRRLETDLRSPLIVDMKLNSIDLIRNLVKSGQIASVLPHSAVRDEIASGAIQAFRIGEAGLFRRLVMCSSQSRQPSSATAALLTIMTELAKEMAEDGYFVHSGFR